MKKNCSSISKVAIAVSFLFDQKTKAASLVLPVGSFIVGTVDIRRDDFCIEARLSRSLNRSVFRTFLKTPFGIVTIGVAKGFSNVFCIELFKLFFFSK